MFQSLEPGQGATAGGTYETLFMNAAANDFRPAPNSVLLGRDLDRDVPADARGNKRDTPAAIGALSDK
jgi:hypothetical protein